VSLNQRQISAIELMSTGKTNKSVAEIVGVKEATICNWKKLSEFTDALAEAELRYKSRIHEAAIDDIQQTTDKHGKELAAKAAKLSALIDKWIESRDPESMKDGDAIRMMSTYIEYIDKSLALRNDSWGIAQMMQQYLEEKE